MNPTKEQMLKWLDRHGWTAESIPIVDAIRALIESLGDTEETDPFLSNLYGVKSAPSPAPSAGKESEGLENWEPDMEGIGGWTRNPAPSPGPTIKQGLRVEVEEAMAEIDALLESQCHLCRIINPQHKDCTECLDMDGYRRGWAVIKSALQPKEVPLEAVLPGAVEEAMEKIITRLEGRDCSEEIVFIKAALRPKVMTREWAEKFVEDVVYCEQGEFMNGVECAIKQLRELGIEVEETP